MLEPQPENSMSQSVDMVVNKLTAAGLHFKDESVSPT